MVERQQRHADHTADYDVGQINKETSTVHVEETRFQKTG